MKKKTTPSEKMKKYRRKYNLMNIAVTKEASFKASKKASILNTSKHRYINNLILEDTKDII